MKMRRKCAESSNVVLPTPLFYPSFNVTEEEKSFLTLTAVPRKVFETIQRRLASKPGGSFPARRKVSNSFSIGSIENEPSATFFFRRFLIEKSRRLNLSLSEVGSFTESLNQGRYGDSRV
jgi:hypothetical protein